MCLILDLYCLKVSFKIGVGVKLFARFLSVMGEVFMVIKVSLFSFLFVEWVFNGVVIFGICFGK